MSAHTTCVPAGQKRAPDFITDGCEPPCGCWELNSGPLEEQAVLLTAEPSLVFGLFLVFETEFLCLTVLAVHGTHFVDQAGLELTEIFFPLPLKYCV